MAEMATSSPSEATEAFLEAFNSGDVEAILAHYGSGAVFVTKDGQVLQGAESMRQEFAGFMAMKPNLQIDKSQTISAGDLVVNVVKWTIKGTGPDGAAVVMEGSGFDVMRKEADGSWKMVIDNPWGAAILD